MKFDYPIEVSGINRIVINRRLVFLREAGGWGLLTTAGNKPYGETWKKTDAAMMKFVQGLLTRLKKSSKYPGCFTWVNRAWVHGDTLNIVRRD